MRPDNTTWNNRADVLDAVQQNGFLLQYASYELRNDKEVAKVAVDQNGDALEYASYELRIAIVGYQNLINNLK